MGTMLQVSGLSPGACPELLNVEDPEVVCAVHRMYIDAGVDIIETNTFGANRIKLSTFGLDDRTEELNTAAVKNARKAAGKGAFVAGSVGPTGRFITPVGNLDHDEAVDIFSQQVSSLAGAGVDLIILETFSDIKEVRAALIAVKMSTELPAVALMTFEPSGLTLLGSSPEAAAITLEAAGADAVGANCGLGPDGILEILRRMAAVTELPLVAMPNAGMPRLEGDKTVFPATPEEMVQPFEELFGIGVALIGGCCGTSPNHTIRMRHEIDSLGRRAERLLTDPMATRLSSRSSALFLGGNCPLRAIGERLNPTGRKLLADSLRAQKYDPYRDEALRQVDFGAQMLDLNVGVPGIDEETAMVQAVFAVQQAVPVPLCLDSPRPEVIEAGLKAADGKVLINSVTGEAQSLSRILPLAKRYGAAVLGLTLDENGIPSSAADRLTIARRILDKTREAGIPDQDLMIDCLTLSAGAEQETVKETIETLTLVRKEVGLNTLLGVSNISFGLPSREYLNATFLAMAASAGLSAAIINPFHEISMGILAASRVILNQDRHATAYIRRYTEPPDRHSTVTKKTQREEGPEESLRHAVIYGHPDNARDLAQDLLKNGFEPMEIGENVLIPAMSEVGDRFARNEYFLPQVLMSARAMKAAFEPLREMLKGQDVPTKGRILMATVEGDIHDIGKNIVTTLLENHGFEVIDLGKNVPADEIVRTVSEEEFHAIGLSALMTTTMIRMKETVGKIRGAGLEIPVVVGGAAVTLEYAQEIGANAYARDATEAVAVFSDILKRKGKP
jgi:5-methyltetrahydrofolate--homocysteine methyltransferase